MRMSLSGFAYLLGFIVLVGVASFLQKFNMKDLNPYQINFLMAIGMLVTAAPALWFKQGDLKEMGQPVINDKSGEQRES